MIVINSDEELQNYITGEYTPVDFYQKTLLLAYGLELYQNAPNDTKLQLRSEHDYVMTVNLRPSVAATHLKWQVAIVVNKLSIEDKINLRITRL